MLPGEPGRFGHVCQLPCFNRGSWRDGVWRNGDRAIPEEVAVAFTYDGTTHAVMMATPQDLEDFAIGFSMSEGIVERVNRIEDLEIIHGDDGLELQMSMSEVAGGALTSRRRHLAGPLVAGSVGSKA
jgi:FdhD protein